jgi:hypothetical protein
LNLRFNRYEAADAILKRRKIPFRIDVHVACARIDHRDSFKDRMSCISNSSRSPLPAESEGRWIAATQFRWIKLGQPIIES